MLESTVDLLALRAAPLDELVETLARLARRDGARAEIEGVSELSIDETVRLIREGAAAEIGAAGVALSGFLGGPLGRRVRELSIGAYDRLSGLVPVLSAAASTSSKGGDGLVLRSWKGNAEVVLAKLREAGGSAERAALREALDVSESYLSHLLTDLEGASLVERIRVPGRRGVSVHLTGEGDALADQVSPPAPVLALARSSERRVEVAAPKDPALAARLRASATGPFLSAAR
jgi:DNA-binding MarR family transcriptional regulator